MRCLASISEDEMVAVFLKTEITSARFGAAIVTVLARDNKEQTIITHPCLHDADENLYRRSVLGETRGYRRDAGLFVGFPDDVSWHHAIAEGADLVECRYVNYDYWVELSGGSRRVTDGAEHIRRGIEVFRVPNDGFWQATGAIEAGVPLMPPILVGKNAQSPLVILEGHVRLTAYCLQPGGLPDALPVIVGYSPEIARWSLY